LPVILDACGISLLEVVWAVRFANRPAHTTSNNGKRRRCEKSIKQTCIVTIAFIQKAI
jgi:hypothetical protein